MDSSISSVAVNGTCTTAEYQPFFINRFALAVESGQAGSMADAASVVYILEVAASGKGGL